MKKDKEEFIREINVFKKERPKFVLLSKVLLKLLKRITKIVGEGIVQTRAKDVVSFAEKIQRPGKKHNYGRNPIDDLTDLCGGRCIFTTLKGVNECSNLIEREFRIGWEDSEDKIKTYDASQFGYLSTHYIVQLNLESPLIKYLTFQKVSSTQEESSEAKINFSAYDVIERDSDEESEGIKVSEEMRKKIFEEIENLNSEVQVRTLLQHAWSEVSHKRVYKSEFPIPRRIMRSFNRISAVLENTDAGFLNMIEELEMFVNNYGAYMTDQEIREEINRLKIVVEIAPNLKKIEDYIYRIVRLARSIEKWEETIEILEWYSQKVKLTPELNREYGLALSKSAPNYKCNQYMLAKEKLEAAIKGNPQDSDAYSILGGWWKKKGNLDKALTYYEKAYIKEPDDSYAVGNYFVLEISHNRNYKILQYSKPIFKNVIAKLETQKEIGVNIPWVYFDLGLFNLFSGNIVKALNNYLTAIRYSNARWMITTTLKNINLLYEFEDKIVGLKQVKQILLLGLAYRFQDQNAIEQFEKQYGVEKIQFKGPIIIIAGSVPKTKAITKNSIKSALSQVFKNEEFTLISRRINEQNITYDKTIVKFSENAAEPLNLTDQLSEIPQGNIYQQETENLHDTNVSAANIQNVIRYWIEVLLSQKSVKHIKVIGVGADQITSFEYRAALVFGSQVGIFRDLSPINSRLFEEKEYKPSKIHTEEEKQQLSEKERLKIEKHPIRLFNLSMGTDDNLITFLQSSYDKSPL